MPPAGGTIPAVPFPKNLLTDDEQLVVDLRPHWWYVAPTGTYLLVALVIGVYVLASEPLTGRPDGGTSFNFLVGLGVLATVAYFVQRYAR